MLSWLDQDPVFHGSVTSMFWNCLDRRETANKDKVFAFSSRRETIKKIGSSSALATLEWKGLPAQEEQLLLRFAPAQE